MGLNARVETLPGHEVTVEEQQPFRVDDLLPSRVMRPADAQDAARGLRVCDLVPAAVVPWGGGTQMRLGAAPRRYQVALSTERMSRLLEYEPADLTCRVEAGWRLVCDCGTCRRRCWRRGSVFRWGRLIRIAPRSVGCWRRTPMGSGARATARSATG